jgi:hypothetical protein
MSARMSPRTARDLHNTPIMRNALPARVAADGSHPLTSALTNARSRQLLLALFATTGFSELCLQVVWQRVISIHSGVDLFASATVVAAFMAG